MQLICVVLREKGWWHYVMPLALFSVPFSAFSFCTTATTTIFRFNRVPRLYKPCRDANGVSIYKYTSHRTRPDDIASKESQCFIGMNVAARRMLMCGCIWMPKRAQTSNNIYININTADLNGNMGTMANDIRRKGSR